MSKVNLFAPKERPIHKLKKMLKTYQKKVWLKTAGVLHRVHAQKEIKKLIQKNQMKAAFEALLPAKKKKVKTIIDTPVPKRKRRGDHDSSYKSPQVKEREKYLIERKTKMSKIEKDNEPFMKHLESALNNLDPHKGLLDGSLLKLRKQILDWPPFNWDKTKPDHFNKKVHYKVGKSQEEQVEKDSKHIWVDDKVFYLDNDPETGIIESKYVG